MEHGREHQTLRHAQWRFIAPCSPLRPGGHRHPFWLCGAVVAAAFLAGCASHGRLPTKIERAAPRAVTPELSAPPAGGLTEPDRVLHPDDMVRITLRQPGRSIGSLEPVQKNGEVATPDGSFVKAGGLTLDAFRASLAALYKGIIGYEDVTVEVYIHSSPYKVVKYSESALAALTNSTGGASSTNLPPATIYPRLFRTPTTVWQAIQREGGVPPLVNPSKINILKQNLERKTLDCGGQDGAPGGGTAVESGDHLFLVPEGTPLSGIFEE